MSRRQRKKNAKKQEKGVYLNMLTHIGSAGASGPGDWIDDSSQYLNICAPCGYTFLGSKWRRVCRCCHQ